uniref:PX domain-containing protein n=1 Tax=Chlamydomonas euryale TaxID=1486919 RepID=A0A6U2HTY4_9CHLO|mmetsp:Transcript_40176/g.119751  ORF Transcript_40176/g.119751 Transcript_40176/m.119751 type:complete len:634 (+) Transcript_40176:211-2112(+)
MDRAGQPHDDLLGDFGSMVDETMNLLGDTRPAPGAAADDHSPLGDGTSDLLGYSQMVSGPPMPTPTSTHAVAHGGSGGSVGVGDNFSFGGAGSGHAELAELSLTEVPLGADSPHVAQSGAAASGGAAAAQGDAGPAETRPPANPNEIPPLSASTGSVGGSGVGVGGVGGTFARTASGGGCPPDAPVRTLVLDPERVESANSLGIKTSHWEYVVRTDSSLPALRASGMEVKRRYSDFDTLHKLLHAEFRGCFIPPLPPKSIIENSAEEFLRLRRADLQAYLRAIVGHPELVHSQALAVFLLQPGGLHRNPAWIGLVMPAGQHAARIGNTETASSGGDATGGGGSKALLGSLMSWMKASTKTLLPAPKRQLTPEETVLRQTTEQLVELGKLLSGATLAARSLCAHMDALSVDCRDLCTSMESLAGFEETQQVLSGHYTPSGQAAAARCADFSALSKASAAQAGIWKGISVRSAGQLVTLHDQHILMPEAVAALREREAALDDVFALEDELAEKKAAMQALLAPPGSVAAAGTNLTPEQRANKQLALAQSIDHLAEDIASARGAYEVVKARNHAELSRLGFDRAVTFRRMARAIAATQARMVQQAADHWAQLEKTLAESAPLPTADGCLAAAPEPH